MNIKIPIPEKVSSNSIYSGKHWAVRKRLADLYHKSLIEYRGNKILNYPVEITYIFTFKSRPLDTTNCTFMAKMIEDSLVLNGVLEDDSPEYVGFTGIYSQKGLSDEVEITII